MYILTNISRSKGNQAIKFGQLIKCDKQSYAKCGRETIPRPRQKWTIDLMFKVIESVNMQYISRPNHLLSVRMS